MLQPFVVNLLGTTVYQDMRRMEELFRNSNPQPGIATVPGSSLRKALDAYATSCCHAQPVRAARDALAESQSPSPVLPLGPDGNRTIERDLRVLTLTRRCAGVGAQPG